jgi:cytidine deaminase
MANKTKKTANTRKPPSDATHTKMRNSPLPVGEGKGEADLVAAAAAAREQSYSPYSGYAVGAALRTKSGKIFIGTNVENAAYPLTNCAERTAIFTAVSAGERDFMSMAVVTANGGTPCGACRQVMAEFAPDLRVIVADAHAVTGVFTLAELLPHSFDSAKLPRDKNEHHKQ